MVFDVSGPWLENALTVNLTSDQTEPAPSVVPGPGAAQLDRHYCTASFFLFLFQESKPIHNCPVRSFLDIESHKQVRKKPESFACQHPAEGWGGRTPPQRRGLIAGSWINDRTVNLPATQIWLRSSSTRFLRFKKKKEKCFHCWGTHTYVMVRANRSEGKSWCGIIKYHELNQRCNELRNRVAPRSGKLGTARRLQVDTGRGHSQNPPWLGSRACDCDLIRKTTRGSDFTHFEAFSLQYIETIPWYETIVREFGRLFLLLKGRFQTVQLVLICDFTHYIHITDDYWAEISSCHPEKMVNIKVFDRCCSVLTFMKCFWGHTDVHRYFHAI